MAANINPQGPASVVGSAVPLAFLIAAIGVALVSYGFIRLTQAFNHAGSVYGLVGKTLGPRSGVIAGWGLLGTYTFYSVVSTMATGVFGTALLEQLGIVAGAASGPIPFLIGGLGLFGVVALAVTSVKRGTGLLLVIEGATVALILLTTITVLVKLLNGTAPGGQTFTLSVFRIPEGLDTSSIFLGVVFGFLSFAGFEAAATMGEEAQTPRRDIPKAILGVVIFGGIYFTFITAVQVMGFGANEEGMKAFVGSSSLLGDLGSLYIGPWVGILITLGVSISAMGCLLACVVGAGVIGTLILLVAYGLATIGAIRFLFFSGKKRVPQWEIVIPLLGLAMLVYTLFRNVWPLPTSGAAQAYNLITIAWLLLAVIGVLAAPRIATRMGERINADENLVETR